MGSAFSALGVPLVSAVKMALIAYRLSACRWFKTLCAGLADVDSLGLELERLHLDREMVDTEPVMKLAPDHRKQLRVGDGIVMTDVGRKSVDAGRDGPDVKV